MMRKLRVVIADDHEIFRDGLVLMLNKQKNLELAGQASNGIELIELVNATNPEIILTDIKMPEMDGVEASRQILAKNPHRKIIALSMFDEENLIVDMLEAGAKGYLLKNADKQEILDAIQTVHEDNNYYCQRTSAKLATMIVKSKFSQEKKTSVAAFTEREIEIIRLICQQLTAQQIADKLFLSKRTVEGYRTKILEKMNVRNSAGVVIYALKHQLIHENDF